MKAADIKGIFPASATPYKKDGTFDPAALESLMRRNINEGASGFFSAGSSAECFLLSEAERTAVIETACGFKDETVIIAHVGAISTNEAVRYAKTAKKSGAHYISATPPFYYGFNNAQIAGFFYDIADAAGMQVLIYNFPVFTGKSFNLNDPEICKLFCSDVVCGIKHTDQNLVFLERLRDLNQNLALMNGYDDTMVSGLALGADGSIGSMFNVMTPHFVKIFNAYQSGDREFALSLQVKANRIADAFYKVGLIAAIKYVLTQQGIEAGHPRKPFTPLTREQEKFIDDVIIENLVI